ncbi:glutathione S-transferase [Legionella spiritensis]|uniref:glutathione S-transferase n=1 Tax=Legionella spiritensis TaxID=452 RepID=UPI000F711BAA|nr:glutathione S-transferase [Legionella spiritensis]VEG91774.1 glutaredoxin 2 [Legionella spiritensis]
MSKLILYTFRRCPYAMRARMALYYAGIDVHIREVSLKNKPQAMLDVSPKGTVPVLVLPDGNVIDESVDIMRWALAQNDPDSWYPDTLRQQSDSLIKINDNQFKPILDGYKYPQRSEKQDPLYYREQAESYLKALDDQLSNTRYLVTNNMNIADVALFPFIRQFAMVDKRWFDKAPYPHLQAWLMSFQSSELFAAVMEKYQPWAGETEPVLTSGRIRSGTKQH